MSQPNINCRVCGGTDFTAEAGFYFCLECNTQSQDVREEVFEEYFGNQRGTSRVLQKVSENKSAGQSIKLTSWEALNYVLKGITDELISFGAKPELKLVTLQLWASYLRRMEVAFTSVDIERKPKLGYSFRRCDAEIVYGVSPKQLKSSWRSNSRSSSVVSSMSSGSESDSSTSGTPLTRRAMLRRLASRKRSLATAEYKQASQDTARSLSQTLEELDSSSNTTSETSKRMKITKYAKSLLSSLYTSSTDEEKNVRKRLSKQEGQSIRNVTTAKIVAIVNIALALNQEDIQVSDFIRLVEEGHISLQTSRKFLPEDMKVDGLTQRMMEVGHLSYKKCQNLMAGVCNELGIEELPCANLERLAERYCLELQLPGEVVSLVKRVLILAAASNSSKTPANCKYAEMQVVSAIVVVMKMLFSLDDCTEYRLSHTASEINRVSREEGAHQTQQFVWSEWMQFVECRKAVVSCFHLPTRTAMYGEAASRDTQLFLQHQQRTTVQLTKKRETKKRYELNKNWVESLTQCLHKLVDDSPENDLVEFPTTLTPLHSYTQVLLTRFPDRVTAVSALLKQDFTSHSLEYIIDPNRTIALGLSNDLNIIQLNSAAGATFKIQNINVREKDSLIIPRFKLNQVNLTANVVKSLKRAHKKDNSLFSTHQTEKKELSALKEIVSDSSEEETAASGISQNRRISLCQTELELFNTGLQYWFCHCRLSKHYTTLDEFEVFATCTFPSSFLWLLRECSRMIGVPTKDLYTNVVAIEQRYKHILNEVVFFERIKNKRKRS